MRAKNVQLSEVCEIIAGQSPPSSTYNTEGIGLPFFQGKADFGEIYPTVRYWCSSPNKIAKPDDILLSVRAPVGDTNICNQESCIGRGLAAIRTGNDIDNKFLLHYLRQNAPKLVEKSNGSTFQAITMKDVREIVIPLPPLTEQKRIAAILDKAEEIKRKREESLKLADEFLKSVFVDMFGDPVTNPKGWEMKTAIDFAQCIVPGRDKPKSFSGGIPWVTTNDLKHLGYTSESHIGLADNEIQEVRARIIPENSVIITCVGDLGIATISKVKMVINQQLHAFQCKENMNNIFFMYAISFQKSYMYSRATKTTVPYMNKSVCNSIPMIYPPAHLQQKFANIFEVVNSQRELMSKSFNYTTSIFSSLSHYAFRGKI